MPVVSGDEEEAFPVVEGDPVGAGNRPRRQEVLGGGGSRAGDGHRSGAGVGRQHLAAGGDHHQVVEEPRRRLRHRSDPMPVAEVEGQQPARRVGEDHPRAEARGAAHPELVPCRVDLHPCGKAEAAPLRRHQDPEGARGVGPHDASARCAAGVDPPGARVEGHSLGEETRSAEDEARLAGEDRGMRAADASHDGPELRITGEEGESTEGTGVEPTGSGGHRLQRGEGPGPVAAQRVDDRQVVEKHRIAWGAPQRLLHPDLLRPELGLGSRRAGGWSGGSSVARTRSEQERRGEEEQREAGPAGHHRGDADRERRAGEDAAAGRRGDAAEPGPR